MKLPGHLASPTHSPEFLRLLDQDLTVLWELSRSTHLKVVSECATHVTPLTRNVYSPGELYPAKRPRYLPAFQAQVTFTGPYEVIQHYDNTGRCRQLAIHVSSDYHVERLKIFHGTFQQAHEAANHVDAWKVPWNILRRSTW
jgi:hypothetical protein